MKQIHPVHSLAEIGLPFGSVFGSEISCHEIVAASRCHNSCQNPFCKFHLQPFYKSADIPVFDHLGQYAIAGKDSCQPREVTQRKSGQSDGVAQAGEGQENTCGHDQDGQSGDLPGSSALDERNLLRADHVYDQRLREKAFDEPAGLEKCLMFR